jgi:hypothetical protein
MMQMKNTVVKITGRKTFFARVNWKHLESGSKMPGNGLMLHIT